MSRRMILGARLPKAIVVAAALAMFTASAAPIHAQYGADHYYENGWDYGWDYDSYENEWDYGWHYDGYYYDDDNYDGDWYYYDYDADTDYEYEPGEGLHKEEWYDPSDWFGDEPGVDYEY